MILFKKAERLIKFLRKQHLNGKTIGFVPTMGALHQGHISLIENAKSKTDLTACSIFVNPTQFNEIEDFKKYPVKLEDDLLKLELSGCDVVFLPGTEEIYPKNFVSPRFELGHIETLWEGHYRPGHFQGVCQVVDRLLDIIEPRQIFVGQKDYQQTIVIKKLVELKRIPVEVVTGSTLREVSGLAMSSRNIRLTNEQKALAVSIYEMLVYISENYHTIPFQTLEKYATTQLLTRGFTKVDYVAIADADTLNPVSLLNGKQSLVVLIAAFVGEIRLIDNIILK